ncbi:hypothetical protein ACTFIW_000450 [Dictyostelium discoideum]
MSLVLPIPAGVNTLLITENDLGRGFNIENGENAKKGQVFICEKEKIKSTFPSTDSNNLSLIRDNESLKAALDVGGELSLSYGLISGKVMGNYIDTNTSSNERMTFLYTRRIVHKIVELDYKSDVAEDISKVTTIDALRSFYGLYYISKIEYGAILDLKITLESSDKKKMENIKGELSGSVTIGALSLSIKGHIDKEDSSSTSKLKVTSSVLLGGSVLIDKTDVKNFDEAMDVINKFKVDPERLVPVRMEVSKIPPRVTPILSIDPLTLNHYETKLKSVGSFYWEFQQMILQLDAFKKLISPFLGDDEMAIYIKELITDVSNQITSLEVTKDSIIKFIQGTMTNILNSDIPCTEASVSQNKVNAQQMIGSVVTETEFGRWIGPTVSDKKLPTYKGTYKYKDGSKYDGFCLNGKRHGKGILKYQDGNIDQIKTIEGVWENDNVSYPSKINFIGGKVEEINDIKSLIIWKDRSKKIKISESLTFSNLSNSNQNIFNYYVNVDLIQDKKFKEFFKESRNSLSDRQRYNYLLFGLIGSGKTTAIELFINILSGQINDPKQLRSTTLEQARKQGQSKTKGVCHYNIEYYSENTWMFGITLVDTPGLIYSGDTNKDYHYVNSVILTLGLERVDGIVNVMNGSSTRKSNESLNVLSTLLSILPNESIDCFSTIIPFCNDQNLATQIRNETNNSIKEKPAFFMDNPWSQHSLNKFKESDEVDTPGIIKLLGVNTTNNNNADDELQKKMIEKSNVFLDFFIDRIRIKSSFKVLPKPFLFNIKNTKVNGDAFFEDRDGKKIINNEANESTKFVLTDEVGFKVGSVFSVVKLSLETNLLIKFEFQISKISSNSGADGFAFVIQSNSNDSIGGGGGSIGYSTIPKKDGAVAIEFDTHKNDENNLGDPNHNHVSIQKCEENRTLSSFHKYSLAYADPSFTMKDGLPHKVDIQFNQKNTTLSVTIDSVKLINDTHVPDLIGLKQAYIGFTASTGSNYSKHSILICEVFKQQ